MLNWWYGQPGGGSRVKDGVQEEEPPETPAPVFAARAIKSALFGTPALPDDTICDTVDDTEKATGEETRKLQLGSMSPTKPQGILLTPGTATSRRKTVSFGTEVVDKDEKQEAGDELGSGQEVGSTTSSKPRFNKSTLRSRLEKARESKLEKASRDQGCRFDSKNKDNYVSASPRKYTPSQKSNQELLEELITDEDFDGDMTLDLNEPHSQSGKYWKDQFERYHEDAKMEMEKLHKYKSLAKSFAKKKDSEAIELAEKLKEEQRRVISMEDKISRLSAQITTAFNEGNTDDSPELIKELARQTALAVQYRAQVEEFRKALEGNEELSSGKGGKGFTSPRTEKTLLETHYELKKAREVLKKSDSLRDEMNHLRQTLATAEKDNLKLREENTKLAQEVLHADFRLEKLQEKCEKQRTSSEEHNRRRDDAMKSLQNDYDILKEKAKSQRRDAEHLLKKRHDQVVGLKRELGTAKSSLTALESVLEKKTADHDRVLAGHLRQIAQLKEAIHQETRNEIGRMEPNRQYESREHAGQFEPQTRSRSSMEESFLRESLIPVPSQPIARPTKSMLPPRKVRSQTPDGTPALRHRMSHSVLSEITNNASKEQLAFQKSDLVQYTPFTNGNKNSSLEEADLALPSPEPSPQLPSRAVHERRCPVSPRPSMFNIASSPPKPVMVRSRDSELLRQGSNGDLAGRRQAITATSRLSSLEPDGSRVRTALPPDRAAAAKARLEQKHAEKKRAQAMGEANKENARI